MYKDSGLNLVTICIYILIISENLLSTGFLLIIYNAKICFLHAKGSTFVAYPEKETSNTEDHRDYFDKILEKLDKK